MKNTKTMKPRNVKPSDALAAANARIRELKKAV